MREGDSKLFLEVRVGCVWRPQLHFPRRRPPTSPRYEVGAVHTLLTYAVPSEPWLGCHLLQAWGIWLRLGTLT